MIYMQGISENRNVYDIKETVKVNESIMSSILSAHALSGCDTVAPYHGVGKRTVVKKLKDGARLKFIGDALTYFTLVELLLEPH